MESGYVFKANPPFGVEWKPSETFIRKVHNLHIGLPAEEKKSPQPDLNGSSANC